MFMSRILILLISLLVLEACTTINRDACSSGDWYKIGVQDGSDGQSVDRFNEHANACKLERSDANRTVYLEGRRKGLAAYCTTVRGYREGALGQRYHGACPTESASSFMRGYELGRRIHEAEKSSSDMTDAILAVNQKLQRTNLSEAERVTLLQEQHRLKGEDVRIKNDLKKLRSQADAMVAAERKKS